MNNNNNTIYGFDVNLICDFFLNTKRQGPGSPDVTLNYNFHPKYVTFCLRLVKISPTA